MSFVVGLVAGFGEPIGQPRLTGIQQHGFSLIRQDLQLPKLDRATEVLMDSAEWASMGGRPLFIVDPYTVHSVPDGAWIEWRNEPEYLTPHVYAQELWAVWPQVQERGLTMWVGAIGNTDKDSLNWLRAVLDEAPFVTHISVHRYPPRKEQDVWTPHNGFRTRASEVVALRDMIGGRPFLVSEVGYHTAWRRRWFFWKTRLSAAQQADSLAYELDFWRTHGAAGVCLYQENDAPGNTSDKYGLRDETGAWKTDRVYR